MNSLPIKTAIDKSPLLEALQILTDRERTAIFLRFWGPCSIIEVSKTLHLSWSQADRLLASSLEKLRDEFRRRGLLHFDQNLILQNIKKESCEAN